MKKAMVYLMIFAMVFIMPAINQGVLAEKQDDTAEAEYLEMEEPVKSFLLGVLPDDYSFYTLEEFLPITMGDVRANGIYISSRVPEGLLPPNVISLLYDGSFHSGTLATLDTAGMGDFDGVGLKVAIGITPEGCVDWLREDGAKRIFLLSDGDAEQIAESALIKIGIK